MAYCGFNKITIYHGNNFHQNWLLRYKKHSCGDYPFYEAKNLKENMCYLVMLINDKVSKQPDDDNYLYDINRKVILSK